MEDLKKELQDIKRLMLLNKNVWDVAECAFALGVSKDRVYHLVQERALPHYKCGKQIRFKREEIEAYQCSERVPTADELHSEAIMYTITKNK